ncbi:MAG: non-hydrolyzing UDP-N-acetylglucosamine 2-epimerase [Bacteriovoracia bacterium]
MKIVTVLGARPQFIKAAPVCHALKRGGHEEILVHTGQHYDANMSDVFFDELNIPKPAVNLQVGSGTHGKQTGEMLAKIEEVLTQHKPDHLLVYGDTNSTLAGALAACKLGIPIAHVEAGLRSFNRSMPEEHNRVLTDHCSELLFCPTETAVKHLKNEGIQKGVHKVGDTMLDAVLQFRQIAAKKSRAMHTLSLQPKEFYLATIHRPYNTDDPKALKAALEALSALGKAVVFPLHPRTRPKIAGIKIGSNVKLCDPLGYLDMLLLQENARIVLTDSGGVQKEAFFLKTPCVTLRTETEWVETVETGWNIVVGTDPSGVVKAVKAFENNTPQPPANFFGSGDAADRIVKILGA